MTEDLLVEADALSEAVDSETPPLILDVRWRLGGPDGRTEFRAGHIPGAVFVDLETELAANGDSVEPTDGRHPLPSIEALTASARSWGLSDGRPVVVYDDNGGQSAVRAWWLLRHAGVSDVRLLDGGLGAWRAAGGALDAGESIVERGSVTLEYGGMPVLSIDEAATLPERGILLDARAPERYRGEVEPIDPSAGHIPGALNAPSAANLDADGRFKPATELAEGFAGLGVRQGRSVGVYCGSGVTAAHDVFALALIGVDAALYPGSWSQWSNHPDRPVETDDPEPSTASDSVPTHP